MKNILITGASRGIGRSAAVLAGAKGWSVVINYAGNREAAEETARLVEEKGGKASIIQGDVSIEADVIAMFDQAESAFGKLDGVVINAGILDHASKLADMDVARMKRVFDVNVLGAFITARECARRLAKSRNGKGGSVVVISSIASRLGGAGEFIDYAASKGAMDTMTIGMARELGPEGIRVNAVRPGLIETDIHISAGDPARAGRLGTTTPLGRSGTADEVGEAILWFLSDASSYATGAILDVSGGR
jgi:NAD(P)-dependent dehydrogenase (short-subunit alcohol dehydrogenase family)